MWIPSVKKVKKVKKLSLDCQWKLRNGILSAWGCNNFHYLHAAFSNSQNSFHVKLLLENDFQLLTLRI